MRHFLQVAGLEWKLSENGCLDIRCQSGNGLFWEQIHKPFMYVYIHGI